MSNSNPSNNQTQDTSKNQNLSANQNRTEEQKNVPGRDNVTQSSTPENKGQEAKNAAPTENNNRK